MFRRLDPDTATLRLTFEGAEIAAAPGESVAAALQAAGMSPFRETPASASPRAPYCMMGVCFECLMEIDGVANRQACLTPIAEGMRIDRQLGAVAAKT